MNKCRVLLVCKEGDLSRLLREQLVFQAGNFVSFESSGKGALKAVKENNFEVILTEFGTEDLKGEELISAIKKINPDSVIIVILDEVNHEISNELVRLGVYDFICKPIDLDKLFFLVRKGADLHALILGGHKLAQGLKEQNAALERQNALLGKRIEESTRNLTRLYEDLRSTYMCTVKSLAQAIDARDHYTHSHSQNVAKYAMAIAKELNLSIKETETIREACELHDLGKIGIEDNILSKPSSLTEEEWVQIKRHPATGAQILSPLTFLHDVIDLVRQHHENYDGSGYPEGRKGEEIRLGARIIRVADAYESMRSPRSYRKQPLTKSEALAEIRKYSGTQFDPYIVEVFLNIVNKLDQG